ncbi:MAG: cytochrome c oxidase subunit II [Pseudobdellovibrionaceae bacterium]
MPPAVTDVAQRVDNLYSFLVIISFIACAILIGGMIYFVFKYKRRGDNDKTAYITHNTTLEFLWSFIPLVLFLAMFAWGWILYHDMRSMPENAREVQVVGYRWGWDFYHKSGKKTSKEVKVPAGVPVKLVMTSTDVLHSFFVPSFRIKQDLVPGRYTTLWFQADKLGEYQVFCTEYCGSAHSAMLATMKVVPLAEYEEWLATEEVILTGAKLGQKLFNDKGCVACHSLDGSPKVGPTFKGVFGHEVELDNGTKVVADENYLRRSIMEATSETVKGFPKGAMPSFQGQISEEELSGLIQFIKELK